MRQSKSSLCKPHHPKKIGLPRVLIVGCGDIGMRCLPLLRRRYRVFALTSQAARIPVLRAAGAVPLLGDLDRPRTLDRLAGLGLSAVLHLAPPASDGDAVDQRTRRLLAVLARGSSDALDERVPRLPVRLSERESGGIVTERFAQKMRGGSKSSLMARLAYGVSRRGAECVLVYVGTTGVYGDCGGAWVDETRPVKPQSARAARRLSAEQLVRGAGGSVGHFSTRLLRVPGIYAEARLPLERLRRGTPALADADDVYTNHIHADDLARIVLRAWRRGWPQRVINAVDSSDLKMGEYFDVVARASGLPPPPRVAAIDAQRSLTPMQWSFMCESRRLTNRRLLGELGYRLRFATVAAFLAAGASDIAAETRVDRLLAR